MARSVAKGVMKISDQCDLVVAAEVQILNEWQAQHTFSETFEVFPDWLARPDPSWAARTLKEEHVKALMMSFRQTGKCNKGIIGCVANDDVHSKWLEAVSVGTLSPAAKAKFLQDHVIMDPDLSIQVVSGDHSREALSRLHEAKPNALPWKSVKVELIITPVNDKATDNLRVIGVRENLRF